MFSDCDYDFDFDFDNFGVFIGGCDDGKYFVTANTIDGEFYLHLREAELIIFLRKFYNLER